MMPVNNRIANLVALATLDAPPGTTVWVDSEGCKYEAVPTYQAATNAIAGPSDLDPISWQPVTIRAILPTGGAPASYLTRAAKTAVGSGVVSLTPGAVSVPLASDVTAGVTKLQSSRVWASSLAVDKAACTFGKDFTVAELVALSPRSNLTITSSTNSLGGACALLLPAVGSGAANHSHLITPAGITSGQRVKVEGSWELSAVVAGQCNELSLYFTSAAGFGIVSLKPGVATGGRIMASQVAGITGCELRQWLTSDGICHFCLEFSYGSSDFYLIPSLDNGTLSYAADGTTGIRLWNFGVKEVAASTVTNLSTASTATITGATAPYLESARWPEDGWPLGGTGQPAFRTYELASRTHAFSAPGYDATSISGTAKPFTLTHVSRPYQTPTADRVIWNFAGTASLLRVELTTADRFKLTRTTDAAATATATFTAVIGHNHAIYSIVFDGTRALLYRQGRLVETLAFSIAGATTFTSGTFGGAVPMRTAEYIVDATAYTATEALQVATALAARRAMRLDSIPLFVLAGQSNGTESGIGFTAFATPGSPASRNGSMLFRSQVTAGWAATNTGWGPTRLQHHPDWADAPIPYLYDNGLGIGAQGTHGSEQTLLEDLGHCAIVRYAYGGTAIAAFMAGGGTRNTELLAAIALACTTIGVDYHFAGLIGVWGEDDSNSIAVATVFGSQLRALCDQIGSHIATIKGETYVAGSAAVVFPTLHKDSGPRNYPDATRASSKQLESTDARAKSFNIDAVVQLNASDTTHYTGATAHSVIGHGLAAAINSLGGL
jgi:hypothetical protein